jgi:hypothetical protein
MRRLIAGIMWTVALGILLPMFLVGAVAMYQAAAANLGLPTMSRSHLYVFFVMVSLLSPLLLILGVILSHRGMLPGTDPEQ